MRLWLDCRSAARASANGSNQGQTSTRLTFGTYLVLNLTLVKMKRFSPPSAQPQTMQANPRVARTRRRAHVPAPRRGPSHELLRRVAARIRDQDAPLLVHEPRQQV